MNRLTYKEPDGTWGIAGMNEKNEKEKLYAVCAKLKDYEETGMQPNEVEQLKDNATDVIINKLKEQREQISLKINEDTGDQFNKLSLMRTENNIATAIRALEKMSLNGKV